VETGQITGCINKGTNANDVALIPTNSLEPVWLGNANANAPPKIFWHSHSTQIEYKAVWPKLCIRRNIQKGTS
jgi:hypothetical protein